MSSPELPIQPIAEYLINGPIPADELKDLVFLDSYVGVVADDRFSIQSMLEHVCFHGKPKWWRGTKGEFEQAFHNEFQHRRHRIDSDSDEVWQAAFAEMNAGRSPELPSDATVEQFETFISFGTRRIEQIVAVGLLMDMWRSANVPKSKYVPVMDHRDRLLSKFADRECERITRQVIRDLQELTDVTLSGDDSPLANIWDEICVQVQSGESVYWESYLETISATIAARIEKLEPHLQRTIWLETDEGMEWEPEVPYQDMPPLFADNDDIRQYILHKYVLSAAANYTNARIRKYDELRAREPD